MEQRYGFIAEDALGQMSHELLRPSHWQSVSEIEAVLAERWEWSGGLIAHRIDGQPVMVANYWHLHAGTDDEGSALVTEVHTDIVDPGAPASRELADVVTTIAQELSQPLAAISRFVGGVQRSVQPAWPDRGLGRGLADAATQIACAGEMLSRVRAMGDALRQPRSRDLHARLTAAITRSARVARQSQELHCEQRNAGARGYPAEHPGLPAARDRNGSVGVGHADGADVATVARRRGSEVGRVGSARRCGGLTRARAAAPGCMCLIGKANGMR